MVVSVVVIRAVEHWARRRDDRQRGIIAAFLMIVLAVSAMDGLLEVVFRHGIDVDLLALRTMILRRNREMPFQVVAVLSPPGGGPPRPPVRREPPPPPPRAPGAVRSARARRPAAGSASSSGRRCRDLPQRDLSDISELFDLPEGQRLVILAGTDQHLTGSDRFRLGLEAIHPGRSGILDAYATARNRPKTTAARADVP